ncbi:MAG: 16S rRNA (cytosine(1402)-N(4))-methyltransferase RsmH [Bacteroides sp.]|nr:MAG: 16S rRNA (cytosine(1402)-N(4))-methyltransferase RsmH [Bacteroides sp.]
MKYNNHHISVMIKESIEGLNVDPNGIYIDATYGNGGHSNYILNKLKNGKLIAFDQDNRISIENLDNRLIFIPQNFRYIKNYCRLLNVSKIDGIIADLGVSSFQLDDPNRGFSTKYNSILNMKMNDEIKLSGEYIINNYSYDQLLSIFSNYGEIRNSKTLAKLITSKRIQNPIKTVYQLLNIINPIAKGNIMRYYAQVFQSIRIEVNDEINCLKVLLENTTSLLKKDGRIVIISYHSIEDRIVKNYIKYGNFDGIIYKDIYGNTINNIVFTMINKKPIITSKEEIQSNKRSRSAKIRIAVKN